MVGRTAADVRDVIVGGESGILAISPPWFKPEYVPSKRRLLWPNGAIATTYTADEPDQLRGPQHDAAWCLTGDTLVTMGDGSTKPLSEVKAGDLVATRSGPKKVLASALTRKDADLWRLVASDGRTLDGTPDHPVFADGTFIALRNVTPSAILSSWQEQYCLTAKSFSTTAKTTCGIAAGNCCTELCGNNCRDQSRTDSSCITSTRISSTIGLRISQLCREASIWLYTVCVDGLSCLLKSAAKRPANSGKQNHLLSVSADTASVSTPLPAHIAHGVVRSAKSPHAITVSRVENLRRKADVYDIAVEDAREFFANGILVHNCDELAAWRYPEAWDQLMFGLRLGKDPRAVVTTTPRPTPIIRDLIAQKDTHLTTGSTYENQSNLAKRFIDKIISKFEGTRLGRQELYAEMLDDAPGALWKRDQIEALRFLSTHDKPRKLPDMKRIIVAVDPSVSADADNAATGIVVIGLGEDLHGYVLEDASIIQPTPNEWALEVDRVYKAHKADLVIGEVNQGGDLIEANVRTVNPNINYKSVRAMRGKYIRAEPIAGLTEQGKIHHVGHFAELEDELCQWEPDQGMKSPNRLDAYVWGFTEVMDEMVSPASGYRPGVHTKGTFETAGIGMG